MALAAIFDLDGTLVTFHFDVQGTRRAIIDELSKKGYDTVGLSLSTPTQEILDYAGSQRQGRPQDFSEIRKGVFAILDRFELESVRSTAPFPDIAESLAYLKSKGVRLSVLTNSGRKAGIESLRRAGLLGFFEFVLTRDETETMKPRPEGIAKAAEMLALPADRIYYVGDSTYDIIAAKRAGMKVISVATGNYSADRLKSEGADFVISSMSELRGVLGV